MFLTTKGRYAVMALVDLVLHDNGKPTTLSSISERQKIDIAYLEQIFAKLKGEKLVKAHRGPGGGYQLARDANEVSIADVMRAVEENFKMTRCSKHNAHGCMPDNAKCATHHLWEELEIRIAKFLQSVTLEDVCQKKFNIRDKIIDSNSYMPEIYGIK